MLTGPPDRPADLRETGRRVIGPNNSCHEIGWNIPNTRGLKEYILMRITDEPPHDVMERHHMHYGENHTIYSKELEDNVTLAIVAMNQCDEESDMSDPLILRK